MPRYDITGQCLYHVSGDQSWTVYDISLSQKCLFDVGYVAKL